MTRDDSGQDDPMTGHDEMTLRRWYLSAAPSPEARQAAIDRLSARWDTDKHVIKALPSRARHHWIVAAVAACAVAALALTWSVQQSGARRDVRLVAFEVRLPSRVVREVTVAGDFNGWDAHATPMQREGTSDTWKTSIALPPGRHVYSFVVDGTEWVIDPLAPRAELDELGPANVIAVSGTGD
jgi:hypothetical protein